MLLRTPIPFPGLVIAIPPRVKAGQAPSRTLLELLFINM